MECLEYSKDMDIIEGLHVLVFMLRGLYRSWKLPVAYYLSNTGVDSDNLVNLIKFIITNIENAGLLVKAIVCDQGTSNQTAHKKLDVLPSKPYFNSIANNKIVALFDIPHLYKSLRNNLLKGDFLYNDKVISFNDVREAYKVDKEKVKARLMPKLSDGHLRPNTFQKMNVRLAVQVFSHSVSAGIRTCIETGEIKSTTAKDTADFLELLDQTFDILNSRRLFAGSLCVCIVKTKRACFKCS